MTDAAKYTPGPWQYVAGCEHHGPYVTSEFGNTICDCYTMTLPNEASTRNGGPSLPAPFLAEMADPNARLIAAAPELYEALYAILSRHDGFNGLKFVEEAERGRAALAKARGETAQ